MGDMGDVGDLGDTSDLCAAESGCNIDHEFFGDLNPIWKATMTTEKNRPDLEDGYPAGIDHADALLDEALRETFPASDPIAVSALQAPRLAADGTARPIGSMAIAGEGEISLEIAGSSTEQPTIFGGEAVLVERLLPAARERLVTIADDAPLLDAARLFRAGTDLVVVCGRAGTVVGVITKTDVVARISEFQDTACTTAAASVMSGDLLLCAPPDLLQDVWSKMEARGLKNVPVAGVDGRPIGVLNARDVLGVLLHEVEDEESLLRDYVMGVGYR